MLSILFVVFYVFVEWEQSHARGTQLLHLVSTYLVCHIPYSQHVITAVSLLIVSACEHCRISPPRFLAECCKRRLNQGSFVLLCFALFAFSGLCLVCVLCAFLPARRYASAGYRDRNVSVCLCVRHAPVLCQNEES